MDRPTVYRLIDHERQYQDDKWGGASHDEEHILADWLLFIEKFTSKAKANYIAGNYEEAMKNVVQISALGVACIESLVEEEDD